MNCTNCGSTLKIGGPPCCDGGKAKREKEAARDLRIERLELRVAALEKRLLALEPVEGCIEP